MCPSGSIGRRHLRCARPRALYAHRQALRGHIEDTLKPKTIDGQLVTGAAWTGLLEAYVAAFNEGVAPAIKSAMEGVNAEACQKARTDGRDAYLRCALCLDGPTHKLNHMCFYWYLALFEPVFKVAKQDMS